MPARRIAFGATALTERMRRAFENIRTGEDPVEAMADIIASIRLDEAMACREPVRVYNGIRIAREEITRRITLHRKARRG